MGFPPSVSHIKPAHKNHGARYGERTKDVQGVVIVKTFEFKFLISVEQSSTGRTLRKKRVWRQDAMKNCTTKYYCLCVCSRWRQVCGDMMNWVWRGHSRATSGERWIQWTWCAASSRACSTTTHWTQASSTTTGERQQTSCKRRNKICIDY